MANSNDIVTKSDDIVTNSDDIVANNDDIVVNSDDIVGKQLYLFRLFFIFFNSLGRSHLSGSFRLRFRRIGSN